MEILQKNKQIIIEGIKEFNIKQTFECGQCFRWEVEEDGSYTGIAYDHVINIKQRNQKIIIDNTTSEDFNTIWRRYLDLDRDYYAIKDKLSHDKVLRRAIGYGGGIRLLEQDVWECLLSFIISSNNMIPRIKAIISSLSKKYGKEITYNGKIYYTFPKPENLYNKALDDLAFCRSGYRCKYILDAAKQVTEGTVKLNALKQMDTNEARKELMKIKGIGPKVADCILLFSLNKYDVFPTDVWIKRVVENLYLGGEVTIKDIQAFASKQYGDLAGFAQQYLFYYAREQKIKKNV